MNTNSTKPPFDVTSFLLFVVLIWTSSWALAASDWTDHLTLVTTVASLAILAGIALARSNFSSRVAVFFAVVYGVFTTGWQIGLTLDPALIWRDRILALLGRIGTFFSVLISSEPNRDPLMFLVLMASLFWIFGCLGSWTLFRKGGLWAAILPPGLSILVNAYFYIGDALLNVYMAVFLFLALLLFVRSDMNRRQQDWQTMRARVPAETGFRISRAGLMAAALLIVVSWIGPTFSRYETVAQFWNAVTSPLQTARDWLGDALGGLRSSLAVIPEYYGDVLNLEAGIEPEDRAIMEIEPDRLPGSGGRFYWRSRVYDHYAAGSWSSTPAAELKFDPRYDLIALPEYFARQAIEVTITPRIGALASLYLPSQPIWVNRSAQFTVTRQDTEVVDIQFVRAEQPVMRGEPYRALASIAIPNGQQLRAAGSEYPDWVTERYLQLPDSITPRTLSLAEEITDGYETPFDKVVAITSWLRSNIEYSRVSAAPPPDVEPIDWFLFDYRIGFCNYYASAEVLLLRSLGIPARLAAGYARGEYDAENRTYSVTAEASHSWPEVYFPGIGWVEFEPTVSQDVLTRPEPVLSEDEEGGERDGDPESDGGLQDRLELLEDNLLMEDGQGGLVVGGLRRSILVYGLIGSGVVALLVIVWVRVNPTSWVTIRRLTVRGLNRLGIDPPTALKTRDLELTTIGKTFLRWSVWLRRLGAHLHASQTPYERASDFARLLPDSSAEGWIIAGAYAQERYGLQDVDEDEVQRAWRALRLQVLLAWIWRATERWREPAQKQANPSPEPAPRRIRR